MAGAKDIRRLAFQTLYQLDARRGTEAEVVRESLEQAEGFTSAERAKAYALAEAAYARTGEGDRVLTELTPDWPPSRQAAVDRAILRLAWHEMTSGRTPPKVIINEAIELAKAFSTDKSPAFINGALDKLYKRLSPAQPAETAPADAGGEG